MNKIVKIYKYGCRPPTAGLADLQEQLSAAVDYYNGLRDAELERRAEVDAARRAASPRYAEIASRLDAIDAELTEVWERIRAARQKPRDPAPPHEAEIDARLKKERSPLWEERRAERQLLDETDEIKEVMRVARERSVAAGKEAYRQSGLYWGTRWLVDMDLKRAAKKRVIRKRWQRREGNVGIQLMKRRGDYQRPSHIHGCDYDAVQIPLGPDGKYGAFRVRVGTTSDNDPIWVECPIKMHRPLPDNAKVRGAYLRVFRRGMQTRYEACVMVESEVFNKQLEVPRGSAEACGIDVGWRDMLDGSIRVAVLAGTDGAVEQLVLPPRLVGSVGYAESLQSAADRLFNAQMPVFEVTSHLWTDEQRQLWAHRGKWRSWKRLARASSDLERDHATYDSAALWQRWKNWRLATPKLDLFCPLDDSFRDWAQREGLDELQQQLWHLNIWRRKVVHLVHMSQVARSKQVGHRRDLYRKFAARVALRYGRVVVEKLVQSDLIETRERDPKMSAVPRSNRFLAAPGELLETLQHAVGKDRMTKVDPAYTTITCTVCGAIGEPTPNILWQCAACGAEADQDAAAARNLLERGGFLGPYVASGEVTLDLAPPLARPLAAELPGARGASSRRSRRRKRQAVAAE